MNDQNEPEKHGASQEQRPAGAGSDDAAGAVVIEDTDGRGLWNARSRYEPRCRRSQAIEGWYLFSILMLAIIALCIYPYGLIEWCAKMTFVEGYHVNATAMRAYYLLAVGGLLGGTVYGAKWLYHAVAKGLWHEDRRLWRLLSPWISLGTTLGVGALFFAGLFRAMDAALAEMSGSSLVGLGFIIGYFSDKALAKMKDVTEVLFGDTRSRTDGDDALG